MLPEVGGEATFLMTLENVEDLEPVLSLTVGSILHYFRLVMWTSHDVFEFHLIFI